MSSWLYEEPSGIWLPFRQADQDRLESSWALGSQLVAVNGGRWHVKLLERLLEERFTEVPARRVVRSQWFRKTSRGLEPYEEAEAEELEAVYQALLVSESREVKEVKLGERQVRLESNGWLGIDVQEAVDTKASWFSRGLKVQRGYGLVPSQPGEHEEELLSDFVGHYFILTHGLGEKLSQKRGKGLQGAADELRMSLQQGLLASKEKKVTRCEVLALEWWQSIHSEELDARLEEITLPRLPLLRDLANNAICDAIFYMQNRPKLLEIVRERLEQLVTKIRQHNPHFTGSSRLKRGEIEVELRW